MKSSLKQFSGIMALVAFFCCGLWIHGAEETDVLFTESYLKPADIIQDILNRDAHTDSLTNPSPDRSHFLISISPYFSSLKLMTQRTLRLGMLEICPDVNRDWRRSTYGTTGLKIFSLEKRTSWPVDLPEGCFVSDMTWSPDGQKIAFLAHLPEGTQVWTADTRTGKSRALSKSYVMATIPGRGGRGSSGASTMLNWTPEGSVITLLVPSKRGAEPKDHPVPASPIIRHTRKKAAPTSTYAFLLRTSHDKDLFEYYTTSQIAELIPGKPPREIGEPAMYDSLSVSPDGRYILTEKIVRPFSYIVSYSSFPRELQVMDMSGKVLSTITKTPLREGSSGRGGGGNGQPRSVTWRPDGKGLSLLWREPRKKGKSEESAEAADNGDKRKDRVMLLTPPFDLDGAQTLISTQKTIGNVSYAKDGTTVFARLSGMGEDCETGTDLVAFDLTQTPPKQHVLLKKMETSDPLKLPGDLMTGRTSNGLAYALTSSDGKFVYLQGNGYRKDYKPRPFIDRVAIADGKVMRIFEGSSDMYENPRTPLDGDFNAMVITRESVRVFPDSWLWEKDGTLTNLTNNRNPFPEFAECRREFFEFTRRDGLKIHGSIALPPGYQEGSRVPGVFWTYPREYTSFREYERAAIRSWNMNRFPTLGYRNASDIWLSQGYAVVEPDIPIIGEGNSYNNNYVNHLVDSMYAAIRKVDELGYVDPDRLGHGGHSYGAFATANILSRSPFFKAGIAGDGAYNRTLTPMRFQRERRLIWEAQDIYLEMSPFFQADRMDTPLLMYHGAADNNTGTFLIQSERYMQALTGLGKNAVLYIYPFESHGPRCKETYMDLWARWVSFFDKYLKNSD